MNTSLITETKGNAIEYHIDGDKIFPRMLELIESAQTSIYVEVFLFYDDQSGMALVDKLVEKAMAGLDVRVLLSDKGTEFNKSYEVYNKLKNNNVKVTLTFKLPWLIKDIWNLIDWVETDKDNKDFESYECRLKQPQQEKIARKSHKLMDKLYKRADKGKTRKEGFFLRRKRKKIFRSLTFYDHRKIIVVDNKTAFLGGMNFGNDYLFQGPPSELGYFHDIGIVVQGEAVREVLKMFLLIWHLFSAEETFMVSARKDLKMLSAGEVGVDIKTISSFPRKFPNEIRLEYFQKVKQAQNSIYLINLFITDIGLLRELKLAAGRGVAVHIISTFYPGKTIESMFTSLLYRGYFYLITQKEKLQNFGVHLHHYTKYNVHAKVGMTDGHWVTIGSSNLDYSSLRNAMEINVSLTDGVFIERLKQELFIKDIAESQILDKELGFFKRIYYFVCYVIFTIAEKYFI